MRRIQARIKNKDFGWLQTMEGVKARLSIFKGKGGLLFFFYLEKKKRISLIFTTTKKNGTKSYQASQWEYSIYNLMSPRTSYIFDNKNSQPHFKSLHFLSNCPTLSVAEKFESNALNGTFVITLQNFKRKNIISTNEILKSLIIRKHDI